MRVLIVDDSVVFRSQIKGALDGVEGIEVVAIANNGKIALQKILQQSIDLIILDMEMPELSGIETIKEIKKLKHTAIIIIFSSHTKRGSELTLEALALGADDFVTKPSGEDCSFDNAQNKIREDLVPRIIQFKNKFFPVKIRTPEKIPILNETIPINRTIKSQIDFKKFQAEAIVIGSSTGGPSALEILLKNMPRDLSIPIFIVQHMPPLFTTSLAKRLASVSGLMAKEATHLEVVSPGVIYVAPGNYHMILKKKGLQTIIELNQLSQRNSVRPSVDYLFESASEIYQYKTLGIILTGMGEDGFVGARKLKSLNGAMMIQDKKSSVVFGMPGAIFMAEIYDYMGTVEELREKILEITAKSVNHSKVV